MKRMTVAAPAVFLALFAVAMEAPKADVDGRFVQGYAVDLSAGPINKIFDGNQRERSQTKRGWVISFDLEKPCEMAIEYPCAVPDDIAIRPLGRTRNWRREGKRLVVSLAGREQFVATSASQAVDDVHVFVNEPFAAPEGPGVRRFGKGEHRPGVISPKSNETIVLDEGAVVHAELFMLNVTNVTVCGRGVLDFSEWERADPRAKAFRRDHGLPEEDTEFACNPFVVYGSRGIRISGITLKDAPMWTLIVRNGSTDVDIENVKIIGNWRYNSDGMNVQASSCVRVHDCFIRSFDDCLVARAPYMEGDDGMPVRDLLFEHNVLWCDWGKNCEIWAGHKDAIMENIVFRGNAFANVHFTGCDVTTWFCSGSTYIGDVVFEDNEYDLAQPRWKTVFQTQPGQKFNLEREMEVNLLSVDAWKPAKNLGNQHFGPADDASKYRLLYDGIRFSNPRIFGDGYAKLTVKSETSTDYQRICNLVVEDLPENVEVTRRGHTDLTETVSRAGRLAKLWDSPDRHYVFVATHRMDWRNHPENSLSALEGAIAAGADVMEFDLKRTKDGVLVVSHDATVDRCTDGHGKIADMTLAEIRKLRLKMGLGGPGAALTNERMPTFAEMLAAAKGRALVNIDQAVWIGFRDVIDQVVRHGRLSETIFKGNLEPGLAKTVLDDTYWRWYCEGKLRYMPVTMVFNPASLKMKAAWETCDAAPREHELVLGKNVGPTMTEEFLKPGAPRLWINTMWESLAQGHTDNLSLTCPEMGWDYVLKLGATVLQTDRPRQLVAYLQSIGRR